jgi:hypothetical protein
VETMWRPCGGGRRRASDGARRGLAHLYLFYRTASACPLYVYRDFAALPEELQ